MEDGLSLAVRSSSTARADCIAHFEYLNSFEKIYICFDNDSPGQKALQEVASLFDFNKVYKVSVQSIKVDGNEYKGDPNEYLVYNRQKEFISTWYNSRRFLPEGIISSFTDFKEILANDKEKEGTSYPFETLQKNTFGIREGERILFTALEGVGKTEIIRAIEYHILKNTEENVGIIHLEENKSRTLKGLAGYELNQPVHLPNSQASKEDVDNALERLIKKDDRLHLYSHFGSNDPNVIIETIRFLSGACNCKYIFLDHISMVVSGLEEEDERKSLDRLSTRLAMLTEELKFALIFVSHVNDEGKTRGSRNISKIADLWVHLDRDLENPNEAERNLTRLMIRKNRFASYTGPAGVLKFDPDTFIVKEVIEPVEECNAF